MANITSVMDKVANSLGLNTLKGQDSGIKAETKSHPLSSILGGENLVITEGVSGRKAGEVLIEQITDMLNHSLANVKGLMAILKATADVNMAIAENLKPNEELQEEIKEKLEELKELEQRLKQDDLDYQEVLALVKAIFADEKSEKLLDTLRAEANPIQA